MSEALIDAVLMDSSTLGWRKTPTTPDVGTGVIRVLRDLLGETKGCRHPGGDDRHHALHQRHRQGGVWFRGSDPPRSSTTSVAAAVD
jgi:hypothetical protein